MPRKVTEAVAHISAATAAERVNLDEAALTPQTVVTPGTSVLFETCYAELRSLAEGYFRGNRDNTLQPTALVHELYMKMARQSGASFESRQHFLAIAASAMRQILVDHARRRSASKRGGAATRVTLTHDIVPAHQGNHEAVVDVLALDAALRALAVLSARQARVVEMIAFGGLTPGEAADVLAVSLSLVEKEWRSARAWLRRELSASSA